MGRLLYNKLKVIFRKGELTMDHNIFQLVFETANEPMVVLIDNKITLCNTQALSLFGCQKDEMLGKPFDHYSHNYQNGMKWDEMIDAGIGNFEWLFYNKSGESFYVEVSCSALEYQGEKYVSVILRDVNERLIASENRFKQLVENVKEVFWIQDIIENKILYVSPMYEKIWGNSCSSLYKHPDSLVQTIYSEDFEYVKDAYEKMVTMDKDFKEEYRIVRADGAIKWIWARCFPVKNKEGITYRVVGIAEDITARKNLEEELLFLATKDGLTGINNRKSFFGLVEAACNIYKAPSTFMMMDIDWYKSINDTYGHAMGDVVLKKFVDICNAQLRADDIFGRVGGEEFAIYLPNTDLKIGSIVAERIRASIENSKFNAGNVEGVIQVTVSIGVSGISRGEDALEEAMVKADKALYGAKQLGRNRVVISE